MSRHPAGTIVVVDWGGGSLPQGPGKLRPAVIVEDHELFPEEYPNVVVVPLTRDEGLAHRSFAERIEPTADNGVDNTCWALAHHVTSVSAASRPCHRLPDNGGTVVKHSETHHGCRGG